MPRSSVESASRDRLDERYGRTPERQRTIRRGIWVAAVAFVIVFAAWVVWGTLDTTGATVDAQDTGFSIIDDHSVEVTWQIALAPGQSAKCALQAQNEAHGIVGWRIVDIPASDARTRAFTRIVDTAEPSVTALIYRCWLP